MHRFPLLALSLLLACNNSSDSNGEGPGDIALEVCCDESQDPDGSLGCCDEPGPDINIHGDAWVIDGQANNVSVNSGVVLFTKDACICGHLNLNSNNPRVYVDAWEDAPPLQVREDANVNANAYFYVQSGGFEVGRDFAANSGGVTLLEGDLYASQNLYLNSAALWCTMEGEYEANPIVDNGVTRLEVGVPDIEHEIDGQTFTGDLDDVADEIAEMLDDEYPNAADGDSCRVHFDYDADTLEQPIRLPMLFTWDSDGWVEVGR